MDIQLKKGLIEAYVLFLLTKNDDYGYHLYSQLIEDGLSISENTLYPIFKRLESDGFVSTYFEEHNSRLRKYYKITNDGKKRVDEFRLMFNEMKKIMNKIIKGDESDE